MSCLVSKFKYYLDLTDDEQEMLSVLERDTKTFKKREHVFDQGAEASHVHVVKSGWCASYCNLADGGRLILNIHFPGDIIGSITLPFENSISGLIAVSDIELCPLTKSGVKEIFEESPKIAALFYAMGMQENVVMIDRLKAVGRMAGENRVALLLLQIWSRLKITNSDIQNRFDMPLSQELIGDALGLSNVYVSKMLKQLQLDGFISVHDKSIDLLRPEDLMARCDFEDRFYKLDTRWYPS